MAARNSRIIIRARVDGADELGQPLQTWATVATLWANIRHISGAAAIKADALTSTVRASISVSKRDGIEAGMQALHGSTVYDIKAVLPDEENRLDMFLVCEVAR